MSERETAQRRAEAINNLVLQIRDDIGGCYFGSEDRGINLPWHGDWIGMLAGYFEQYRQATRRDALREYREAIAQAFHLDHMGFQVYSRKEIIAALDRIDIELDRLASEGE